MRTLNGLLKLGFGRGQPELAPDNDVALPEAAPPPTEIDVVAYAEDCILTGRLALAADRLSDVLNDQEEYELIDVVAQDLAGNPQIEIPSIVVQRDEILLVQAAGPRGDPNRRNHTRQHAIIVRIGPYEVSGLIHALPGTHPIDNLRRRRPMVALTDVTIEFSIGPTRETRKVDVVILNRQSADSVAEAFPASTPDLAGDAALVSA